MYLIVEVKDVKEMDMHVSPEGQLQTETLNSIAKSASAAECQLC